MRPITVVYPQALTPITVRIPARFLPVPGEPIIDDGDSEPLTDDDGTPLIDD